MPVSRHFWVATTNASWTASSAMSIDPKTRTRMATQCPDSARKIRSRSVRSTAVGSQRVLDGHRRSFALERPHLDGSQARRTRLCRPLRRGVEIGYVDDPDSPRYSFVSASGPSVIVDLAALAARPSSCWRSASGRRRTPTRRTSASRRSPCQSLRRPLHLFLDLSPDQAVVHRPCTESRYCVIVGSWGSERPRCHLVPLQPMTPINTSTVCSLNHSVGDRVSKPLGSVEICRSADWVGHRHDSEPSIPAKSWGLRLTRGWSLPIATAAIIASSARAGAFGLPAERAPATCPNASGGDINRQRVDVGLGLLQISLASGLSSTPSSRRVVPAGQREHDRRDRRLRRITPGWVSRLSGNVLVWYQQATDRRRL